MLLANGRNTPRSYHDLRWCGLLELRNACNLVVRKCKAEHIQVACCMVRVGCPDDNCDVTLNGPSQGYLSGGHIVLGSDALDKRIAQNGPPGATKRRPRLQLDLVLLAEVQHSIIMIKRIPLYLVHLNWLRRCLKSLRNLRRVVIPM